MEQVQQLLVQISVQLENIVLQEVHHVQTVPQEHIPLMKVQQHVPLVEQENIVLPEVQHVVI